MQKQDLKQLTLFPEDFPASPSVWLESKKEKGMTVTCGRKCSELSASLSREPKPWFKPVFAAWVWIKEHLGEAVKLIIACGIGVALGLMFVWAW